MRRYVGYVLLSAATLIGVAGATAPFIAKMNADLAYSDGKTLYFKASEYDEASSNGNYGNETGSFLDQDQPTDPNNDNKPAIHTLANIVKDRLDIWNLSEYEVSVQGYDTIAVSVRTKTSTETQYTYLENYLSFSGGDYELDVTDEKVSEESKKDSWAEMLDDQEAFIQSIELNGYNFPVVLVKIPDTYKSDFTDLLKAANDANSSDDSDSSSSSASTGDACKLVLWANRIDGDLYKDSTSGGGNNRNLSKKILAVENVSSDNAIYYYDSDENKDNPYLRLIPNSAAITSDGGYDASHAQEAYDAAVYLRNMFNASELSFSDGTSTKHRFALNFTYSENTPATVESLNAYTAWSVFPALSGTLIATLVTIALMVVVLALFNRSFSLIQIASIFATVFSTFALFVSFGAQFNVAACLGLLVTAILSCFGSVYYGAALKDEIYKGRTLKKANQEAAKKSTWPIIDASIVSAVLGVFVYIFGGELASKFGTMLVLGAVFALASNLILTRIGAWLFCNDSTLQSSYPKRLGIDSKKIPDLLKEEKQTYFGPYEKKDFTKSRKWTAGILGAVVLAGIASMIAFGIQNGGNVYNTSAYTQNSTVLRIDVRSTQSDMISLSRISSIEDIYSPEEGGEDLFHRVQIDGKSLASMTSTSDISLSETPLTVYDSNSETTYYWFYYSIKLNKYLENDVDSSHEIKVLSGDSFVSASSNSLDEALTDYLTSVFVPGSDDSNLSVRFATVTPELGQPYIDKLCLALGVALACDLVYLSIRFRPSRGISATLGAATVGYCSIAFFVFTRISVTPLVTLGCLAGSLLALIFALFAFNKEKEIYKESREKEKNTVDFRYECLKQGVSRSAGSLLLLVMISAYGAIAFFGFGPRTFMMIYLAMVMGLAFLSAFDLSLMAPFAYVWAKLFSKITIKPLKRRKAKKGNLPKKKGGEPEEATFIGINDY